MMTSLLDDAAERGEPVAILLASEAGIYGRFGFGKAADACRIRLDRRSATLRPFDDPGTIDRVEGKGANCSQVATALGNRQLGTFFWVQRTVATVAVERHGE